MAVGQGVTEGSLRMTLEGADLLSHGDGIAVHYNLTNVSDHDVSVHVNNEQFSALDAAGHPLKVVEGNCDGNYPTFDTTFVLKSGASTHINPYCDAGFEIFINTSVASNTKVTAIISNMGSLTDARWTVPILH
jgi:hypothetical protein